MTNYYISEDEERVTQITVRNVSLGLRDRIKREAKQNNRSMNGELLFILERYFLELDAVSAIFQAEGEKMDKNNG